MRLVLFLTFVFSTPAFAAKAWFMCKTDADCVLSEDPCAAPNAVNKKHLKDQEAQNAEMRPMIKCMGYKGPTKDTLKAFCGDGQCKTKAK